MSDKNIFDRYLLALRKTPVDEKTEHTDRAALQALLQAVSDDGASGVAVQHEPKRVANKGAPDFKVTKGGLILGYVENKVIGENLDKVLKSDQITRYKSLSQNIILTDYLHFIWISKDGNQRETLCHAADLESPKFRLREDRVAAVNKLLEGFFSTAPEGIGRAQQLALALATRSKLLHDYLGEELVRQEREHKEENFSSDFRNVLDTRYEHHYTPEEILGYIYAVLHAPTYRTRYAEFLHIDFPRVPFPESSDDFETLSVLGWALVQAHLLRELPRRGLAAYHGKGDHTIEAVRYSLEEQAVSINNAQSFKPVPLAVWEFYIGGYPVLDKYLKSRKGRVLSLDEINHVGAVADSLAFTIEQMIRIDEAYRAAFPERG